MKADWMVNNSVTILSAIPLFLDLYDCVNGTVDDCAFRSLFHALWHGTIADFRGVSPFIQPKNFWRMHRTGAEAITKRLLDFDLQLKTPSLNILPTA